MAFDLTATMAAEGGGSKVQGVLTGTERLTVSAGAGVGDEAGPGAGSLVVAGAGAAGVVPLVTVLPGPSLLTVTPETERSDGQWE